MIIMIVTLIMIMLMIVMMIMFRADVKSCAGECK